MKVYKQLVRTFLRSGDMEDPKQKKQKLFYALLGVISVVFIMIPMCGLMGYLSYAFTLGMQGGGNGFLFIVHFIGLFSVVFGINVILNVFYFAGDIPFVLPLPIPPYKVIAAKFTTAYINESVMQIMILISAVVGFLIGAGSAWWQYPIALVGVVTLPLVPLAYCGIFCVIIMGLTNWIRNKSHARKLSMLLTLVVVCVAIASLSMLKDVELNHFVEQLQYSKLAFMNVMNRLFITNYWLTDALANQNVVSFLLYLIGNIVVLSVFLILAQLLYYRGLIGIGGSEGGRKKKSKNVRLTMKKPKKVWVAYLKKEWCILVKTPAFFLNCIVVNILWPVLGYVIYMMQSSSGALNDYLLLYQLGFESMHWLMILGVIALSVVLAAANSIASSAITREGKYYYVMKYIPVSYKEQLRVKALLAIGVSGFFAVLYIVLGSILAYVNNLTSWYYIIIALLSIVFITYFGLYLDTVNPKLAWDDELNALRGNTNVFFNMAYAMILTVVFLAIMAGFYFFTKVPLFVMEMIIILLLLAGDGVMIHICYTKGVKNLENLD